MLLGPGRDIAALPTLPTLAMSTPLRFEDVQPVGDDLRIRARRVGADAFLRD